MDASVVEDLLLPVVLFLTMFGTIFGVSAIYLKTRSRERLSLIEHGMDPAAFQKSKRDPAMMWALLVLGVGLGLLVGYGLEQATQMPGTVAYTSMVLIFGGSGLFMYHMYQGKRAGTRG